MMHWLCCPQGELEWLLAMLERLHNGKVLAVSRSERDSNARIAELAHGTVLRVRHSLYHVCFGGVRLWRWLEGSWLLIMLVFVVGSACVCRGWQGWKLQIGTLLVVSTLISFKQPSQLGPMNVGYPGLCHSLCLQVARRQAALSDVAERLAKGSAALAAAAAKEDAFYGELARLQRYWKVGLGFRAWVVA